MNMGCYNVILAQILMLTLILTPIRALILILAPILIL